MTTGQCWQAIAPRLDISRRTFDRLIAQWRATGNRPARLQGIEADLDGRSQHHPRNTRARWLRLEVRQDG